MEILAKYVDVIPKNLLLTNGSDQAVDVILRSILESGDEVDIILAQATPDTTNPAFI